MLRPLKPFNTHLKHFFQHTSTLSHFLIIDGTKPKVCSWLKTYLTAKIKFTATDGDVATITHNF